MRFAVFSDIHSNLEGMRAVLGEAARLGADSLLCCGDMIGYNADPNACVEMAIRNGVRCIQGNHERGLRELEEGIEPNMNPMAMEALLFTNEHLTAENRDWLLSLPEELLVDDLLYLFHGSPSDPDEYVFDAFEAAYAFKSLSVDYPSPASLLCFIGHTHICAAYIFDPDTGRVGERVPRGGDRLLLRPGAHHMFNTGSCGQYRGGSPVATMCILDSVDKVVEFRFLPYDVAASQAKVIAAGLPVFLAKRLEIGQ